MSNRFYSGQHYTIIILSENQFRHLVSTVQWEGANIAHQPLGALPLMSESVVTGIYQMKYMKGKTNCELHQIKQRQETSKLMSGRAGGQLIARDCYSIGSTLGKY